MTELKETKKLAKTVSDVVNLINPLARTIMDRTKKIDTKLDIPLKDDESIPDKKMKDYMMDEDFMQTLLAQVTEKKEDKPEQEAEATAPAEGRVVEMDSNR